MNRETRTLSSVVMAVAGALLLMAVALMVAWVLDLSSTVAIVLLTVALVAGAWYGWRLTAGMRARQTHSGSGHGSDRRP